MKTRFALALTLIFCCSCTTIYWQQGLREEQPALTEEVWHHEFFFGFLESQGPLDLTQLCPVGSDFEVIRVRKAPLQVAIGVLSLGIYTPNAVAAVCRKDL